MKLFSSKPLSAAWRLVSIPVALALAAVGAIAASRVGFPLAFGAMAGAAAALLGVFALPSLSTRRVVVLLLGIGGLGALRHASFSGTDTGALLVCWAGATLVALLLVDRAASEQVQPLPHGSPLPSRAGEVSRVAIATAVIAAVAVVAFGPLITQHLGRHVWPGLDPSFGDAISVPASLRATDQVNMTQRPRLSDRVVFTVDAARPDFWRGQTFDDWDGDTWTQTRPQTTPLVRDGDTAAVAPDPYDPGAVGGKEMRQTYHVETEFSNVLFAAPSPVSVQTDKVVEERTDGTLTVFSGYGKGAAYTVTSRSSLPTATVLRASSRNAIPPSVAFQYGRQTQHVTERVQVLSREVTASARTPYDKIRAIEAWLGADTKYSIDAPLAPQGVDVVDDFLFRARVGWCEQIASSLVVMARTVGIPARLATGFVPGRRDTLTGQFVVRERDSHAWAEIYFPGVGWQPFDPTASVPLAGEASSSGSLLQAARNHAIAFGLLAAALVLLALGAPALLAGAGARAASARRRAAWSTRTLAKLERIGRKAGRPRVPAETPREYATALAVRLHDDRVRTVGDVLDADGFSAGGAPVSARADAEAVLSSLRP